MDHFSKVCPTKRTNWRETSRRLSSAEDSDSDETSGRIVVGKLESQSITVKIGIQGAGSELKDQEHLQLATDTGVSKTLLNRNAPSTDQY